MYCFDFNFILKVCSLIDFQPKNDIIAILNALIYYLKKRLGTENMDKMAFGGLFDKKNKCCAFWNLLFLKKEE